MERYCQKSQFEIRELQRKLLAVEREILEFKKGVTLPAPVARKRKTHQRTPSTRPAKRQKSVIEHDVGYVDVDWNNFDHLGVPENGWLELISQVPLF